MASFVQSIRDSTLIGKCTEVNGREARVAVFRSPTPPEFETIAVPCSDLKPLELPPETLVYRKSGSVWSMARVLSSEIASKGGPELLVQFPNQERVPVPTADLFVRCPSVNDDPTLLLAAQVTTSPHFTEARQKLSAFVASQRAAYRGLTSLACARVEIHQHQLAAVKRVLSDPVQRYLLADEVGLGKTIEAGLLIAQHLIDEPEASVLLFVPDALVEQWRGELLACFAIRREDPKVAVHGFSALERVARPQIPTMLVVDEAHQAASWAFASQPIRYRMLETLGQCPKVLLLSGTPVLNHEDGFLAMLHLLDPASYSLDDREGFRRRVTARQPVADALSELTNDYQADFLREALTRLRDTVDDDVQLVEHVEAVERGLAPGGRTALESVVALRSYLTERYRLHRRMVRTHRESPSVASLLPRRRGLNYFGSGVDERRSAAADVLNEWRASALQGAHGAGSLVADAFWSLVTSAVSHPLQLRRALFERADGLEQGNAGVLFEDEASFLRTCAQSLGPVDLTVGDDVRAVELLQYLTHEENKNRRVVVFTDAESTANDLVTQLRGAPRLSGRALRFSVGDTDVVQRYRDRSDAILVCDRAAEEGLNLQHKAATIVFFDLPLDIGRIEQRIGRFDRLEGMRDLHFCAPKPVGEYEAGWADILQTHVRIFERSVARLQYVLAEELDAFRATLLQEGPRYAFQALAERLSHVEHGLDSALRRIQRQEILDTPDWVDEDESTFVEGVVEAREVATETAPAALGGWLEGLQFEIHRTRQEGTRYRWVQRQQGASTLAPVQSLLPSLERWVDRTDCLQNRGQTRLSFGPFVFEFDEGEDASSLLGLGHPFFDHIVASMQVDDRSRSWAVWRVVEGAVCPQLYLRFDLVLQLSLANAAPLVQRHGTLSSLRRRADAAFPVERRMIWIDVDGDPVTKPQVLELLNQSYSRVTDQNLNNARWSDANERLEVADWPGRITFLRQRVSELIEATPELARMRAEAKRQILAAEHHTVATLEARALNAPASEREAIEAAIQFERTLGNALRLGVENLDLRVDNAGAVILAGGRLRNR